MKYILLGLILLFSVNAQASKSQYCKQSFELRAGGWSKHMMSTMRDDDAAWNETHDGFGFTCNERWGLLYFTNSWDEESLAILFETRRMNFINDFWKVNLIYGATTGYDEIIPGGVLPMIAPKIEFSRPGGRWALESMIIPGVVGTLNVRYKLW